MANGELAQGPWLPLYVGDFIRGTVHLSDAEVGCYLRLLMHQWVKGSIPDDVERLTRITGSSVEVVADIAAEFFPGGINPRLADESAITQVKRQAAHDKGVMMAEARWRKTGENPHSSGRGASSKERSEPHRDPESPESDDAASNAPSNAASILGASTDQGYSPPPPPPPSPESSPEPQSQSPAIQKAPRLVSDAMWNTFKESYPARRGNQYWAKARKHAEGLVKANVEWSDIMAGVRRYRAQSEATGMVGTEKIKQAQFWLQPKEQLWTEDFPLPNLSERTSRTVHNLSEVLNRERENG